MILSNVLILNYNIFYYNMIQEESDYNIIYDFDGEEEISSCKCCKSLLKFIRNLFNLF